MKTTCCTYRSSMYLIRKKIDSCMKNEASKSLAAALFYGLCSISLNFLNKAVVSSYNFNFPFFIMFCQMLLVIGVLSILRTFRIISIEEYSFKKGGRERRFFLASLLFALHSTVSLTALHGMNIPMYTAIKRCGPAVSLILSVLVLKKSVPSKSTVLSIITITIGCLVAFAGDLEFDTVAYVAGLISVFAQAGYLTLVQKASAIEAALKNAEFQDLHSSEKRTSSQNSLKSVLEMIHINAFNTLPVFAFTTIAFGELQPVVQSKALRDPTFYSIFLLLLVSGGILTYSQFLCASVCSALTASLVGVGKSVLQMLIGLFTFGGVKFHPLNVTGLVLNTAGGILYSFVKYREGLLDRRKKDYLKAKENDTNCDMNQNSTKTGEHRLPLASVESEYSDSNRDKHRIALSAISAV